MNGITQGCSITTRTSIRFDECVGGIVRSLSISNLVQKRPKKLIPISQTVLAKVFFARFFEDRDCLPLRKTRLLHNESLTEDQQKTFT